MTSKFLHTTPVLSSSNIKRDIEWYKKYVGFESVMEHEGYAVLHRDNQWLHLQWHNNTKEDPVYSSIVKFFVDNIQPIFNEMVERGTVSKNKLNLNTAWNTSEFALFDLNKNAIYFVTDID